MSENRQRIFAPVLVLLLLLITWEGLVTLLRIEQFLLPKPSAILSNLVRVVTIDTADARQLTDNESAALLRANHLVVRLPGNVSSDLLAPVEAAAIAEFSQGDRRILVTKGVNLTPIVQASWFTLKEALGGLAMGAVAGILVALATAHPAKFPDAVEAATGIRPPLPEHLADLFERPERVEHVDAELASVQALVRAEVSSS